MEKTISAIEISDTEIRLAVGYEKDDKINLIHVATRPINGLISNGEIMDFQTVSSIINSMREFKDETTKEKVVINEATLVLPSIGLNVFQSTKTTSVVSPYSLIATIDIENVVWLVQKEMIPEGTKIVDIIPDSFILEMGRSFINPPINEKSNNLTIKAKIHALPARVIESYKRVVEAARIKVNKMCVSSYAMAELAKNREDIPQSYFLVDIGSDMTNITLVGNNSPFDTTCFACGGDNLIARVTENFGTTYDDSLEIIQKYGFDERPLSFKPSIIANSTNNPVGNKTPNDLNFIIKQFFFEEFFPQFDEAFAKICKGYPESVKNLPLVFTGGVSNLFGLESMFKERFSTCSSIHYLEPLCVGAREPKFSAVVGAILAASKYKGALSDMRPHSSELQRTREDNK